MGCSLRLRKLLCDWSMCCYRQPVRALLLLVMLIGLGAWQLRNLALDSSNEAYLKEDDPILLEYQNFQAEFGNMEPIFIGVRAKKLFDPVFLETLRSFTQEIEETLPFVERTDSLWNAHYPLAAGPEGNSLEITNYLPDDLGLLEPGQLSEIEVAIRRDEAYIDNIISSSDAQYTAIIVYKRDLQQKQVAGMRAESTLAGLPAGFADFDAALPPLEQQSSDLAEAVDADELPAPTLRSTEQDQEMSKALEALMERYHSEDFRLSAAGSAIVVSHVEQELMRNLWSFSLLSFLAVLLILSLLFRQWIYVLCSCCIVLATLLLTMGAMAAWGVALTLPTQALPPFLLVIAIGDAIHILSLLHQNLQRGQTRAEQQQVLRKSIEHAIYPCFLTSLTTALGFLSFLAASIAPVADLGVYTSVGICLAFFLTFCLVPTLFALAPQAFLPRPSTKVRSLAKVSVAQQLGRMTDRLAAKLPQYAKLIIACGLLLFGLGIWGASRLSFGHDPLAWFPESDPVRRGAAEIDRVFQGSIAMNMLLSSNVEGGVLEPELLRQGDEVTARFLQVAEGKAARQSISPVLRNLNRTLLNDPAAYRLPETKAAVEQELTLYESARPEQFGDFVNFDKSMTQYSIRLPWTDSSQFVAQITQLTALMGGLKARLEEQFPLGQGDGKVYITGVSTLMARIFTATISSTWRSYLFSILTVCGVLVLSAGRLRWGLLALLPNLLPIACVLGILGFWGLPLDLFNMLSVSIVIGLAVDDTVHILAGYSQLLLKQKLPPQSAQEFFIAQTRRVFRSTGRAIVFTSAILISGFATLQAAYLNNFHSLSIVCVIAVLLALLSDLLLLPALLYQWGGPLVQQYTKVRN